MRPFAALYRFLERRRRPVVARDLRLHYGIDIAHVSAAAVRHPAPACEDCPPEVPAETARIADYMHQQNHDLHVLQWQGQKLVAKMLPEGYHDRPVVVPFR